MNVQKVQRIFDDHFNLVDSEKLKQIYKFTKREGLKPNSTSHGQFKLNIIKNQNYQLSSISKYIQDGLKQKNNDTRMQHFNFQPTLKKDISSIKNFINSGSNVNKEMKEESHNQSASSNSGGGKQWNDTESLSEEQPAQELDGKKNILLAATAQSLARRRSAFEGSPIKANDRMALQKILVNNPEKKEIKKTTLEEYMNSPFPITRPEKVEINSIFEELYTIDILGLDKASTGAEKVDSNDYFIRLKEILYNDGYAFDQYEVISNLERQQILSEYLEIVFQDYFCKEKQAYKKSSKHSALKLDKMLKARDNRSKKSKADRLKNSTQRNFIAENISKVLSFTTILKRSSEQVGCLVTKNLPMLMHTNSFTRSELYEFFTIFKTLCDITSQKLKLEKKEQTYGAEKHIWERGVVKLNILGDFLVRKIYFMLNVKEEGYIDWEEFIQCMKITNTRTFKDKIDLFVNISDDNGNGLLDRDEVYQYCRICLQKFMRTVNEDFLEDLTDYFTRFIFQTCGYTLDQEIPANLIRQLIMKVSFDFNYLLIVLIETS